jgi:hypothetical protein
MSEANCAPQQTEADVCSVAEVFAICLHRLRLVARHRKAVDIVMSLHLFIGHEHASFASDTKCLRRVAHGE